jgi:hypothetical protein
VSSTGPSDKSLPSRDVAFVAAVRQIADMNIELTGDEAQLVAAHMREIVETMRDDDGPDEQPIAALATSVLDKLNGHTAEGSPIGTSWSARLATLRMHARPRFR